MKIYRTETICADAKHLIIAEDIAANCGGYVSIVGEGLNRKYAVLIRREFLREWHVEGKALLKLLPAWAKHHVPRNIGVKVTEFYALNEKVVTRLHHSGFVVGSPEFHDWQETQPDPFRSADAYRRAIGELRC